MATMSDEQLQLERRKMASAMAMLIRRQLRRLLHGTARPRTTRLPREARTLKSLIAEERILGGAHRHRYAEPAAERGQRAAAARKGSRAHFLVAPGRLPGGEPAGGRVSGSRSSSRSTGRRGRGRARCRAPRSV